MVLLFFIISCLDLLLAFFVIIMLVRALFKGLINVQTGIILIAIPILATVIGTFVSGLINSQADSIEQSFYGFVIGGGLGLGGVFLYLLEKLEANKES